MGREAVRMKILLLGANGQVGQQLQRSLVSIGRVIPCTREQIDLNNMDQLRKLIRNFNPDVIVNAAAYTAVDDADDDIGLAHRINAESVGLMAQEARFLNSWLIHYSTDYVFDGTQTQPYSEAAMPNPLNVYGWTKLQGEELITKSGCNHLIFRTSWVYGTERNNFAKTVLRLASELHEFKIVNDQFGVPTSASLIAEITSQCIRKLNSIANLKQEVSGIYNLTPSGCISWYGFACFLVEEAEKHGLPLIAKSKNIIPIPSSEYPTRAKRPKYSLLDNSKIQQEFDLKLPGWKHHAQKLVLELTQMEASCIVEV